MNRDVTIVVYSTTGGGKTFITELLSQWLRASNLGPIVQIDDEDYHSRHEHMALGEKEVFMDQCLLNLQGKMRFRLVTNGTTRAGFSAGTQLGLVVPFDQLPKRWWDG